MSSKSIVVIEYLLLASVRGYGSEATSSRGHVSSSSTNVLYCLLRTRCFSVVNRAQFLISYSQCSRRRSEEIRKPSRKWQDGTVEGEGWSYSGLVVRNKLCKEVHVSQALSNKGDGHGMV